MFKFIFNTSHWWQPSCSACLRTAASLRGEALVAKTATFGCPAPPQLPRTSTLTYPIYPKLTFQYPIYIYVCVCVPILLESPYAQRPIYFVHFKIFQVSRSLSANPRCINGRPFRWKASRAFAYLRKKMHERVEKSTKIPVA